MESDRIKAMQQELGKMGGKVQVIGDTITVPGSVLRAPEQPLYGHNDHRIVMALTVAALAAGVPATIRGAEAVRKSWPLFFVVMRSRGAKIDLVEGE